MRASVLGWTGRILLWLVILIASAVLVVTVLVPRITGGTPYTILTGSMRPGMPPGTLVVDRPVDPAKITVGMVVTYQLESGQPQVVTHRVISQGVGHNGELIFQTKGDSNRVPDQKWVRAVQIRGQRWYSIRYLGYANVLLTGREHQLLVYGLALGLGTYAITMFGSSLTDRRRKAALS